MAHSQLLGMKGSTLMRLKKLMIMLVNCAGFWLLFGVMPADEGSSLPILQGPTGTTVTQIAIMYPRNQGIKALLQLGDHTIEPVLVNRHFQTGHGMAVYQAQFAGLEVAKEYTLKVYANDGKQILDQRTLQTLGSTSGSPLKFAVASCMDDSVPQSFGIWLELLQQNPDMVFLIGDNVYADRRAGRVLAPVTEDTLWQRYAETRQSLPLFTQPKLVPIIAIWDDHDFGKNDGDRDFPLKEESQRIFRAFFPQYPIENTFLLGPGVSSVLKLAGQQFVFLDDRSFRFGSKQSKDQSHFGSEQLEWLKAHLASQNLTWLISGDQFFGNYHGFESFEGTHPYDFKVFIEMVRNVAAPVAFLSGDRHLFELMRIESPLLGYETFEFTTSPIHAKTFPSPWRQYPNPRQIAGAAQVHNYGMITSHAKNKYSVIFEAYTHGSHLLHRFVAEIGKTVKR